MAKQKKSFLKMAIDSKGNPAAFKKEVEENSAFTITEEQAAALLGKGFQRGDSRPRRTTGNFMEAATPRP